MSSCQNCDGWVCYICGNTPVTDLLACCDACDRLNAHAMGTLDLDNGDEGDSHDEPLDLRAELNTLAAQIVAAGGLTYAQVHMELNQEMGIGYRGQASTEQLLRGMTFAEDWLAQLRGQRSDAQEVARRLALQGVYGTAAEDAVRLRMLAEHLTTTIRTTDTSLLLDLARATDFLSDAIEKLGQREVPANDDQALQNLTHAGRHLHEASRQLEAAAASWR